MADQTGSQPNKDDKDRSRNDLLLWLALLPFVLISLFCVGEVATLTLIPNRPDTTVSRFAATYQAWPFTEMPPIDMQAVARDFIHDNPDAQLSTVENGILLRLPTTSGGVAGTPLPTRQKTPSPVASNTPVAQLTPTPSNTPVASTSTPRVTLPPPITVTPSRTPTNPPPPPQPTDTEVPPPEPPDTPVPPTPTWTPSLSPTMTFTPSISPTLTPSLLPYVPVVPILEGTGISQPDPVSGGCQAFFGYLNSNPQPVTINIQPGVDNFLSINPVVPFQGTPPTNFKISRVFAAFRVVWTVPADVSWTLNGTTVTAGWCNPPAVP